MSECYCDYGEPSDVYVLTTHAARKAHKCHECHRSIKPGERYERAASLYDGLWTVAKTCQRCLALRDYVQAHVPCLCWLHGSLIEDCIEAARYYHEPGLGLLFGAYRRQIEIRRNA